MRDRAARLIWVLLLGLVAPASGAEPSGQRLAYVNEVDLYYPHRDFPKLVTPQWVGEPGVDAVVVLAIDDMRDTAKYEAYLRPILNRLKAIDGRAPVSIMTNQVDPKDPQLQSWLKEGLSIEVHTLTHPCPCLQKGDFAEAKRTFHGCVDLMSMIPGNKPVAFRMPCCDSLNTPCPRFFAEILHKQSPAGRFLSIDSSVFMLFTADDPSLPRNLVFDTDGKERFRKYVPFPSFVNTIENYPYPYLIGGLSWEFPCVVPSDWEGQNLQQPSHPRILEDMKVALDLVVLKQGVFNLVFHPNHWIANTQVADLVDYAARTYGKKVKFLTFREAKERLDKNLLDSDSLRTEQGEDRNVRLIDLNHDHYLDIVNGADHKTAKVWDARGNRWNSAETPTVIVNALDDEGGRRTGLPSAKALPPGAQFRDKQGRDAGLRFVDLDEDGYLDVLFSNDELYGIYLYEPEEKGWTRKVMAGKAREPGSLPKIVRDGTNNGFFVHSRHLWWQNEETSALADLVERRSFNDLLKDVEPRAKSPEASLRSIRTRPGFAVELVASEPLVGDPIAFDWGADGKLWVVEMGDYPLGADHHGKPGGRIRILEDTNGDGRYDKATTFLEGLALPNGVMPWRKGVLISCSPDILYAEDRDGDGKADHREVLFTGFVEGNPQHRANGFEWGLDGWIYGANGDSGGTIRSVKTGQSIDINGRDFRFRPDTGEFEAECGMTQFGRHRDDWGRWFGNSNPTWGWQFVFSEADLKRNPHFAPQNLRQILESDTRLFPVSRTLARFNDPGGANHLTSANSPTSYRDDLFGPSFASSLFVSEPVHNMVHRMVLEPEGPTLRGRRGPDESHREFLASSDNWFRPTMLKTGPDGSLWVADMYRAVIEHPEWIPDDWEAKLDLRAGSDQGRIYRVFPVEKRPRPIPRLDRLDTRGLVAALESPSGWQRDTAQRLLIDRKDPAAIEALRALVIQTKRPQVQVQALWTLSLFGGLEPHSVLAALGSAHPQVRRNAIKIAEALWKSSPEVADAILKRVADPEGSVRLQLALSLGNWSDPRAGKALGELARKEGNDPWIRTAVLSSAVPHVGSLLVELFRGEQAELSQELVDTLVALAAAQNDAATTEPLIKAMTQPAAPGGHFASWQFIAAAGFLSARERAKPPANLAQDRRLAPLRDAARTLAQDDSANEGDRIAALRLLGCTTGRIPADRDLLAELLKARVPISLQQAAIQLMASSTDSQVADLWLRGWKGHSPQVRNVILDALLTRQSWTNTLLTAIQDGRLAVTEIDPARRQGLLSHRDPETQRRAREIFADHLDASRKHVLETFRPALGMKGDAEAGSVVFKKLCTSCHRLGNQGVDVGPDLASLNDKSPESLLVAILDPNRAFEAKYAAFNVATTDGRVLTGLVVGETANSVTLRRQDGKDEALLRSDIEEMASSGHSLMPEGLEKDLQPRDLADLMVFLAATETPAKSFVGNQPRLVRPDAHQALALRAADAEIRGDTLVFEAQYGNLGYWTSANDRASWTFQVERAGRYSVRVDSACPDARFGNVLEVRSGSQILRYLVQSTGSWDDYRAATIGSLDLPAGTHRLTAHAAVPLNGSLFDLRTIELKLVEP